MQKFITKVDAASKVLQSKILGKNTPLSVTFLIKYQCNLTCKYCDIWKWGTDEMTTSQVKSMIDEFFEMGMRRFSFNGGEALLRPDIEELTRHCREKNIFTTLFTNGWLVPRKIEAVRQVDVVLMSLDGPEEIHDLQRDRKGSHKRVVEAIKLARSNGVNVWTNTVITKHNVDKLDYILNMGKELDFWSTFQPVLEYSHSTDSNEIAKLAFDLEKYQAAIDLLLERKRNGANLIHSKSYLEYVRNPNWAENKRKCYAGELYCAVKPNGEVSPCYPEFNERKWPNGLELGFKEAFRQSNINSCRGCYCMIVESDFTYSLNPTAIANTLNVLPLH